MKQEIRDRITEVHKFYWEEVRKATIQCENLIGDLPDPVYIEVRNGFDHIARVEAGSLPEEKASETLTLGVEHFKRSIVDAWEIMTVFLSDKINNVINNLETSIPARASRGSFYFKLFEAQKLAIGLMNEAREMKALKYDLARENFQKAFNILEKALKEFFGAPSLQEYLVKRDKESSRNRKIDFIIYFILGIITGVIATLITRCIIK